MGTMSFGGEADSEASRAMYQAAREAGINFFDTADQYNAGRAEEILGELIRGQRDELIIATKGFNPLGSDINAKGASRRHLTRACEASLKRLGTDRVEVYYVHHQDPRTPLEESVRGLEDLVRAGKILYPALSNHAAWQTQQALDIEKALGWAPLQVIQPMYNLIKRTAEIEILPMAQAHGLGVVPYSPSAGGLLSGKYLHEPGTVAGRLNQNPMYAARYGEAWAYAAAARFAQFCRERDVHPVSMAVAWVAAHPGVTAPIIGARNLAQLEASLAAPSIDMSKELRAEIAALSPAPPPATDRTEEATRTGQGGR
jgi:aryl-alcohol dehydrogenase-like predicted oxidoreductase